MKMKSTWTQNAGIGMFALLLIFTVGCGREGSLDNGTRIKTGSGTGSGPDSNPDLIESKVYIYATTETHQGNLGGREGADQICENDSPVTAQGYESHALLGYSGMERVTDLANTYGLPTDKQILAYGTEAVIADNWDALMSGSDLNMSMEDAGVLTEPYYWTGFTAGTGETSGASCGGFVTTGANGQVGYSSSVGMDWYATNAGVCTLTFHFLCVAYVPAD